MADKTSFTPGLAAFLGAWQLRRQVRFADGGAAWFEGQASWTPDADGALYQETGWLEIPGQGRFLAERRYRWTESLDVFFDDGRFFHHVPVTGAEAEHLCPPDLYRVTYDFATWPAWSCQWRVTGPRKEYRMTSYYTRA